VLTRLETRLETQGFLTRCASNTDARASMANLTETGWQKVVASAPGHVHEVRAVVFDPLTARQVGQLSEICGRLLGTLDPDHLLLDRD
jgi:DNA-binding MarR family transcriptional regulator